MDVYTSNHLLARRDVQEWEEFYNFFNLSCSFNGDDSVTYLDGPKECYSKDVVYGDMKQFQFDVLRTEFMGLGTRGGRLCEEVVVDEVDSILLDEGSKLAMLSTTFTGMDKLEPIYHIIRSTLIRLDSDETYYSVDGTLYHYKGDDGEPANGDGTDLNTSFEPRREYLKRNMEAFIRAWLGIDIERTEIWKIKDYFQLPPHLLKYAKSQVSNWAEAAVRAEALEENKDYLLVDNKVVPIDPHTGVLQESSHWTNGLHQFFQIKHHVDFTPESPKTNYLSNWAMVKKYKDGIVGLTGTLGSPGSLSLLSQHMSADFVSVPDRVRSRFIEFPNSILSTRREWREAITNVTETEISVGRAVLIICQTVKEAQSVYLGLKANSHSLRVKLHDRSDTWMEHHLQQVQPGDVIVTTNLGTRGMDIQASTIESVGGLHVILAYMPPNTRIVRQAFGRTSRKGNLGSGHFIIKQKHGTLQPAHIMNHITSSEMSGFERYFEHELPLVTFKDEVYADFVAQYCQAREEVRQFAPDDERSVSSHARRIFQKVFDRTGELSGAKFVILEAIQEVWSTYLKLVLDPTSGDQQDLGGSEFEDLLVALNEGCRDPKKLFRLPGNCYHPTRYGFQVYRKLRSLNDAQSKIATCAIKAEDSLMAKSELLAQISADYFKMAVDIAPTVSPAAHVGLAYVLLKRGKNGPSVDNHYGSNYKADALNYLKNATTTLETDVMYLRYCLKQLSNPSTSRLANQLTKKLEAVEAYVKVVDETSRTVRHSLRPVQVTATNVRDDTTEIVWISDGNVTGTAEFNEIFEPGREIELKFHGLKANKDVGGYRFQCKDAVKLLYDKMGQAQSENTIGQPTVSLIIEGDDLRRTIRHRRTDVSQALTVEQYK